MVTQAVIIGAFVVLPNFHQPIAMSKRKLKILRKLEFIHCCPIKGKMNGKREWIFVEIVYNLLIPSEVKFKIISLYFKKAWLENREKNILGDL